MVGKIVGSTIYVHRSVLDAIPSPLQKMAFKGLERLPAGQPYDIIKINKRTGTVSFCEALGWRTLDEPIVGLVATVPQKGKITITDYSKRNRLMIYHHKWMMVKPSYKGFDVEKSRERSKWIENHPYILRLKKSDPRFKSRIGFLDYWESVIGRLA